MLKSAMPARLTRRSPDSSASVWVQPVTSSPPGTAIPGGLILSWAGSMSRLHAQGRPLNAGSSPAPLSLSSNLGADLRALHSSPARRYGSVSSLEGRGPLHRSAAFAVGYGAHGEFPPAFFPLTGVEGRLGGSLMGRERLQHAGRCSTLSRPACAGQP